MRARTHVELPFGWNGRGGQVSLSRALGDLAQLGSEQGSIDGPCALERFSVDRDVDQGIEPAHRAHVARFGSLNAQVLGC